MNKIVAFFKKEIVLTISLVLAVISVFFVPVDREYLKYIDFRTLEILFSLMVIVAGMKELEVFDVLAGKLLQCAGSLRSIICVLVFLCFFLSMLITNDVALITFVPFTITVMKEMGEEIEKKWMFPVIVMQTIAANLGSMFTPVGNPQNLYLYGLSGKHTGDFFLLMFPYTMLSFIMLLFWIFLATRREMKISEEIKCDKKQIKSERRNERLSAYMILLILCLLAVSRVLSVTAVFALVLLYVFVRNKGLFKQVDYSLLGTFAALFIFIGNLGRIPSFHLFLQKMISGKELFTAVIASQVMSNVPTAILLSGFTENITDLIVGTNLGGLGTLIASMASLISFKYAVQEKPKEKGKYLRLFTVSNLIFLAFLSILVVLLGD